MTTTNVFTANVTATGIQTIAGLAGLTSLNVTGNVVASNAVTATTHYGNVVASNVVVTPATGVTGINVTGNIYASNAVTTTNVFTGNVTATGIQTIAGLPGLTSLNVTGNLYVSNTVTTNNINAAGFTSNASNTNFFFDTLTIPFLYTTTLNVASTSNIGNIVASNVVVTPATGVTGINVTGNIYASNAMTTNNVFATGNIVASGNLTVSGAAGTTALTTVNVTGNIYTSNAVTATTHYGNVVTSNVVVTPATGVVGINVTGNVVASNAVTTNNVFVSNVNFASTTLGTAAAGQLQYNTYLYGTVNTTSGRGSIPTDYIYRIAAAPGAYGIASNNFFTGTSTGTGALLNLEVTSVYDIEAHCYFLKTTAGTLTWQIAASSAPTFVSAYYVASPITGIGTGTPVSAFTAAQASASVNFAATGSLTTAVNHSFMFKIQVITNAATTLGLNVTQSAGTMTSLAGSYYRVTKLSTTTGTFS